MNFWIGSKMRLMPIFLFAYIESPLNLRSKQFSNRPERLTMLQTLTNEASYSHPIKVAKAQFFLYLMMKLKRPSPLQRLKLPQIAFLAMMLESQNIWNWFKKQLTPCVRVPCKKWYFLEKLR